MEQQAEYTSTDNNIANKTFESLLTKRIYDDIHGFVALTEDEKKLLSHPYMRRLHFIKQNALANFIFPGATHTRFSHSVGVLYIVEKMIQKLKTLPKEKIDITPIDHQVVRLAALLHDVGHYPLSHTIEDCFKKYEQYFLQTKDEYAPLNENDAERKSILFEKTKNIKDILKDFPQGDFDSNFHHEKIAKTLIMNENSPLHSVICNILKNTYQKLYGKNINSAELRGYIDLIGQLIHGDLDYSENFILTKNGEYSEKYFILSLLINSDLDADQMDYMLRDTKNTGIQATIRTDFLIDNLDICYIKIGDYKQPVLCFNYKAIESVQQFIFTKAYWYTEIILYDKVCILNKIAKRVYMYNLFKENKIKSFDDFCKQILFNSDEYIKFTDFHFWNKIHELMKDKNTPLIIQRLINILLGSNDIPEPYYDETLRRIEADKGNNYFKTNIFPTPIMENEKNEVYDFIQETYKDPSKFPIYFTNKFFKKTEGETGINKFINRSIYILRYPCDKKCTKECLNAFELLNSKELGTNIIHRVLGIDENPRNNIQLKQAYVDKIVVYQFKDLY